MAYWRDGIEPVTYYNAEGIFGHQRWNTFDLCYDNNTDKYCVVTEFMARDGVVRYVSDEFALAFIKEFGE